MGPLVKVAREFSFGKASAYTNHVFVTCQMLECFNREIENMVFPYNFQSMILINIGTYSI